MTEPEAISAPDSGVVPAQPPTPPARTATTATPAKTLRRIDRRVGEDGIRKLAPPGIIDDLERARRWRAVQHFGEHLVLRTERDGAPLLHCQEEIHPSDCRRAMGDDDGNAAARSDAENRLRQRCVAVR